MVVVLVLFRGWFSSCFLVVRGTSATNLFSISLTFQYPEYALLKRFNKVIGFGGNY